MLTYSGSLTLGQCVPMALLAGTRLQAGIGLLLPELQARLAGILEIQARLTISLPPIQAVIAAAQALLAALEACLMVPGAAIDLTLIAGLVADLELALGALGAHLSFGLALIAILGTPGIFLYTHTGPVGDVLPGGLPGGFGPRQEAFGVLLLATDAGAISALQQLFRT